MLLEMFLLLLTVIAWLVAFNTLRQPSPAAACAEPEEQYAELQTALRERGVTPIPGPGETVDDCLGRFLRANKGVASAAAEQLADDVSWRLTKDVATWPKTSAASILGCDEKLVQAIMPSAQVGLDREGHPRAPK